MIQTAPTVSDHTPATATIASVLAALVGLVWLGSTPWPLAWGWMPALSLALVVAVLVARRAGAAPLGGWVAAFRPRRPAVLLAVVFATGFVAAVFGAVLLGATGEVLVAFPAAIVPTVVAVAVMAFASRLSSWLRLAIAPLLVGLALFGARYEADGVEARGGAYSGPILGIHPFQSTAVVVDGYGPFDLPINDFVEPAGDRGYDPAAYGEAVALALHRIAQVHYSQGPLRAYQAFALAEVESITTPAVRERLDRDLPPTIADAPSPRIAVRSGTTGARSSVEFVCPGRRDDPRPPRPEAVMTRSCPTKYAPEASAGLGLTGRWPGYSEWRGNERMGLVRLLGGTRHIDEASRDERARERWGTGVIAIVLVVGSIVALRRKGLALDLRPAAMLVLPLGVLVLVVAVTQGHLGALAAFEQAPAWQSFFDAVGRAAGLWIGLAAIAAWWIPRARGHADARVWPWLAAVGVLVLAASDLEGARWLAPTALAGEAPIADAVARLADRIATSLALVPTEGSPWLRSESLDAIVASSVAAALVAAGFVLFGAVSRAGDALPEDQRRISPWLALVAGACAVALAVSRKTDGGVALIPAATGVAIALGSALRRVAARGVWPRDHVSLGSNTVHLSWCLAGAMGIASVWSAAGRDPVLWLYAGIATCALVLLVAVCLRDRVGAGPPGRAGAGTTAGPAAGSSDPVAPA